MRLALAALPLWLAACAPLRPATPDSPAATVSAYRSVPASAALTVQTDAVPDDWWALLQDPTLAALERDALAHNLDLAAALSRLDQGRAALGAAEALDGPSVAAGACSHCHSSLALAATAGCVCRPRPGTPLLSALSL